MSKFLLCYRVPKYLTINVLEKIDQPFANPRKKIVIKHRCKSLCSITATTFKHLKVTQSILFFWCIQFYSMASSMNARNLLAYWSGSAVEMPSTLEPYFTVFAALAVIFLTP